MESVVGRELEGRQKAPQRGELHTVVSRPLTANEMLSLPGFRF